MNAVRLLGTNKSRIDTGLTATDLGINGSNSKSIEFKMYITNMVDGLSNGGPCSFFLGNTSSAQCIGLVPKDTTSGWRFFTYYGDSDFTEDLRDKWVHVAVTYNGTILKLYFDGTLKTSITRTLDTSDTYTLKFGWWDSGNNSAALGAIFRDIRVWDVCRTQAQIVDNIDTIFNQSGNETNLVGYWKCDEGTGTTLNDVSLNDNNASIIGDYSWWDSTNPINVRVTQQYIEAAVTTDSRNAKVTQQYLEAAVTADNRNARITQQYIEAACLIVPIGYNHKIMGIMNPSKIYGLSTFTKVNSIQ